MRTLALACLVLSLAADASAGARDDQRLIVGARGKLPHLVEAALAAGADIDAGDAAGRTALMWAAFHGDAPMLRYLLEAGAGVNARDRRGRGALTWAAIAGRDGAARALLEAGADPAAADGEGRAAAAHAAAAGHAALAELLAAAGARPPD